MARHQVWEKQKDGKMKLILDEEQEESAIEPTTEERLVELEVKVKKNEDALKALGPKV